jgi:hydrogenase expression/formation protein HypE
MIEHQTDTRPFPAVHAGRARRPMRDERVTMAHGAGGKASRRLIETVFLPRLADPCLHRLEDAAILTAGSMSLAFTTDAFVVRPLRFPGGSIGQLAVNGTANDLAVSGAVPLMLSASFILEEGLPTSELQAEVDAMADAADLAGVAVVTADTKVVERGHADGMYLTTSGIGLRQMGGLGADTARPGDAVICSGPIGDHGIAILLARGDLELSADITSDTRCVWPLVAALNAAAPGAVRVMRDATRGGVATVLNELATSSRVTITIDEAAVPVRPSVRGACELLGIDPLYVANEGTFVAIVKPRAASDAVDALRSTPGGRSAEVIGEVGDEQPGLVVMRSLTGGHRIVDLLVGDPLPRIC